MMSRVRAVALRALLVAAKRRGLRRLGEMHDRADRPQLLNQKPPPRRRLQRDLQPLAGEPRQEPASPPMRSAGRTRARLISPLVTSIHSAVSCARC
jgi:hypothetical protein